jgi:hypothetical protein
MKTKKRNPKAKPKLSGLEHQQRRALEKLSDNITIFGMPTNCGLTWMIHDKKHGNEIANYNSFSHKWRIQGRDGHSKDFWGFYHELKNHLA